MAHLIDPNATDPASQFMDANGNIDYAAALQAGRTLRSTEAHSVVSALKRAPWRAASAMAEGAGRMGKALRAVLRAPAAAHYAAGK